MLADIQGGEANNSTHGYYRLNDRKDWIPFLWVRMHVCKECQKCARASRQRAGSGKRGQACTHFWSMGWGRPVQTKSV